MNDIFSRGLYEESLCKELINFVDSEIWMLEQRIKHIDSLVQSEYIFGYNKEEEVEGAHDMINTLRELEEYYKKNSRFEL